MLVSAIRAEATGFFCCIGRKRERGRADLIVQEGLSWGKAECPVLQGSFGSGLRARQETGNHGCNRSNIPMSALNQHWWSCSSAKPGSSFFWLPVLKGLLVPVQVVSVLMPLELGQPHLPCCSLFHTVTTMKHKVRGVPCSCMGRTVPC